MPTPPEQPLPGLPEWWVAGDRYPSPSKVSAGVVQMLVRLVILAGACAAGIPRTVPSIACLHTGSQSSAIIVPVLSCHPRLQGALSVLEETELKAGKFGVIRSLLRALDGGAAAKAALDTVIDACSGMQVS